MAELGKILYVFIKNQWRTMKNIERHRNIIKIVNLAYKIIDSYPPNCRVLSVKINNNNKTMKSVDSILNKSIFLISKKNAHKLLYLKKLE
jgi:hypothetical protein